MRHSSSFLKPLVGLSISYVAVAIYVNASAGDWYGGATFGPRRVDNLFPALVIGAALFITWSTHVVRRSPHVIVVLLVGVSAAATLILAHAYRSSRINVGMVGAHEFPYRATDALIRSVGWVPSLPAEVFYMARDGTRLGQYSALAHDDPHVAGWADCARRAANSGPAGDLKAPLRISRPEREHFSFT